MLTDIERQEIQQELAHYPDKRSACIEALKVVQHHRAWVSDDSLKDLAELLEMTPEELDGVATFYNLIFRKPVGRHVTFLCNSISCWMMGHEEIRERLEAGLGIHFGETTSDGRMTLLPIVCLGACDHAPVMMVDEDLHDDLTPGKAEKIVRDVMGNG
jgi:NADH-quinone oxidoreductase subunit E